MVCRNAILVLSLIGLTTGAGSDKPAAENAGFQSEVPVKQATRLDWTFAAMAFGSDAGRGGVTPPPGTGGVTPPLLPDSYDSTRQQYQLYVPPAYDASKAWPLVVFLSPGDDPLGWRSWQKPCEDQGALFCAAYGAGANVAPGQRVRIVLDMLDDVRRRYHVDPDQTYLAGLGGGGRLACTIAFALPEFFGGVVVAGDGAALNDLEYLRWRVRDRLSVALIAAGKDHPLGPYFDDMGVRCKTWTEASRGGVTPALPAAQAEAYAWLAGDLDRRRAEARARPGLAAPDEAYTNLQQATLAVDAAKVDLTKPEEIYRGATLLEGVAARWGRTEPADAARTLLQEVRADPVKRKKWQDEADAEGRRSLAAGARLSERLGDLHGALQAWEKLAAAQAPDAKKASEEVKRLTTALAAAPYLGLTLDAELIVKTVAPDGPAAKAGVRVGDRLVKLGTTIAITTDDLRSALQALKPGDKVTTDVVRDGEPATLVMTVGGAPAKE